jgi:ankyrin repeat protein
MADKVIGASSNQRLLAAARDDNEDMMIDIFEKADFDINFEDGIGNTALHYAASCGSTVVLEYILSHDDCDVDPVNRLQGATPLHLALEIDDKDLRKAVVESLLDAGANTKIKDKNGDTVLDLLRADDTEIRALIRKAEADATVVQDDIASDDEDGPSGSGSGSGSDE